MKRNIILSFLVMIGFLLVGCNNVNDIVKPADEFTINGINYKLNTIDTEYDITYKTADNFKKIVFPNAVSYYSESDEGSYTFIIRIFRYKNFNIDAAIKDLGAEDNSGKKLININSLEYTYIKTNNDINIYLIQRNGYAYAFTFVSKENIDSMINYFLKNIEWE